MNFSHLEYAMTVAECRSINKAAQRLLVSQPYLSGVLKNLEEELGCQLFKRSHVKNYEGDYIINIDGKEYKIEI